MLTKTQSSHENEKKNSNNSSRELDLLSQQTHYTAIIQRLQANSSQLSATDVMQLQRTIGNSAVGNLLREIRLTRSQAEQTKETGKHSSSVIPRLSEKFIQRKSIDTDSSGYKPNKEAVEKLIEVGASNASSSNVAGTGNSGNPSAKIRLPEDYNQNKLPKEVNVYDDAASHRAAAQLGAYAYSWKGDVFLGPGLDKPGAPSRTEAVHHELIHSLQARNSGILSDSNALEAEANNGAARQPKLKADPEQPLGLWWVIPVAAGLYVLLRPNVANAPAPGQRTRPSVSELQIAAEALALFAVPSGVVGALGRAGYGIVASFAISGAASSVAYRGVQDVSAGEFSGVEAYVVDSATGAVIGVVIGGVLRSFAGAGASTNRSGTRLVHLTSQEGHTGITGGSPPTIMGRQGIYAVPETVASESVFMRQIRTLLSRQNTARSVPIPGSAQGAFSQPVPIGPISLYQKLAGVYRAPAGAINLTTGQFAPSGRVLANVTGQFWPYGMDAMIWTSSGFVGSSLSPSSSRDYQRGLFSPIYNIVGSSEQPEFTTHNDGPFIFIDPSSSTNLDESSREQQQNTQPLFTMSGQESPLIILVAPMVQGVRSNQSQTPNTRR